MNVETGTPVEGAVTITMNEDTGPKELVLIHLGLYTVAVHSDGRIAVWDITVKCDESGAPVAATHAISELAARVT